MDSVLADRSRCKRQSFFSVLTQCSSSLARRRGKPLLSAAAAGDLGSNYKDHRQRHVYQLLNVTHSSYSATVFCDIAYT